MTAQRKLASAYVAILLVVASINNLPVSGLVNEASLSGDFSLVPWWANLPHLGLGAVALAVGFASLPRDTRPA